jgi:hypothetical protein
VDVAEFVGPMSDGTWLCVDASGAVLGTTLEPKGERPAAFEESAWRRLKRSKVKIHRGDLLRLIPGEVVSKMVRVIQAETERVKSAALENPF